MSRGEVSIMLTRSGESGLAPEILLNDRGMWSPTTSPRGTSLDKTGPEFKEAVQRAVKNAHTGDDAVSGLVGIALSLTDDLVAPDLESALASAAKEANRDKPPLLRIHLYPEHEWIPWEMLHDGEDFFGLKFRIARLPIVMNPPRLPGRGPHAVGIVRSLLGRDVADPGDEDYQLWETTFDELVPADAMAELVPDAALPDVWPKVAALREEADIVHLTCHGVSGDTAAGLSLDPSQPEMAHEYEINDTQLNSFRRPFSVRRPLVFANACSENVASGPDRPVMANALFGAGALNCIATLAPIRRALAVRFARSFYVRLLGEGLDISTALLRAKQDSRGGDPTFLLYCLYGSPETRFAGRGNGDGG
jgi:hypothetical protein